MAIQTGRVALVTGASKGGIGGSIAVKLASEGISLYLASYDSEEALQSVASDCREANPDIQTSHGRFDFSKEGDAVRMVESAHKALGRIDILINNAVVRFRHPFGEYSSKEFDESLAINLKAPFLASQAVIPIMKELGGGRIINIASSLGVVAEQNHALYGLTKAALIHLTKSMAFELTPHNILVNAVSPGPTLTDYNKGRISQDPAVRADKMSRIRAGRYGRPEEIAEVVRFLATTEVTYLLGQNVIVDGGCVID